MRDIIYLDLRTKREMILNTISGILVILIGLVFLFDIGLSAEILNDYFFSIPLLKHMPVVLILVYLLLFTSPVFGMVMLYVGVMGEKIEVDHKRKQIILSQQIVYCYEVKHYNISEIHDIRISWKRVIDDENRTYIVYELLLIRTDIKINIKFRDFLKPRTLGEKLLHVFKDRRILLKEGPKDLVEAIAEKLSKSTNLPVVNRDHHFI